jgi:hypothetical protein
VLEISHQWTALASSGPATPCSGLGLRLSQTINITVGCQAVNDTVVFGIEAAPQNNSTNWTRLGSTAYSVSSGGQCAVVQLTGGVQQIRPYIIAKTASTTLVDIQLDGVSGA